MSTSTLGGLTPKLVRYCTTWSGEGGQARPLASFGWSIAQVESSVGTLVIVSWSRSCSDRTHCLERGVCHSLNTQAQYLGTCISSSSDKYLLRLGKPHFPVSYSISTGCSNKS